MFYSVTQMWIKAMDKSAKQKGLCSDKKEREAKKMRVKSVSGGCGSIVLIMCQVVPVPTTQSIKATP